MARILQFNFEDPLAQYIDSIKGEDVVNLAIKLHCDTLVVFARDAFGRTYYDSDVYRKVSKLGARDFIREVVEAAKKYGVKVVAMIGHTTNPQLYKEHPNWAQRDVNGRVITMDSNPESEKESPLRWPLMCLNSPFLNVVIKEISEVLKYGINGVFLDSFRYMPDLERACFCEYCERTFREEFSRSLSRVEDWSSKAYRDEFLWRYHVNVKAIKAIHEYIKKIDPNVVLIYNSHPAGWKGRANTIVEMARNYIDVVFAEGSEADFQPPGFLAEIVKLSQALSGGKRVCATRNSFHAALTTMATTPIAVKQGLREVFMAGGDPMILVFSSTYSQDLVKNSKFVESVSETMAEIEKLEEYMVNAERIKYAGVVFSNRSRDWAGRGDPRHITDEIRGFYYALTYGGLPVDFIADWQLDENKLRGFKVLIMPNTASISRRGVENVKEFSKHGGIVATYMTSLIDERGDLLEEFSLGEVLGVSYQGLIELPWSYVVVEKDHEIARNLNSRIILWGDYDRVFKDKRVPDEVSWHTRVSTREGAEALAYIGEPSTEIGYEYENGRSPPLLGSFTKNPAIVLSQEYKSVYFTGQLGRLYWRTGLEPYEKLVLNSAMYAGGVPPVHVRSDGLVLIEAYERSSQLLVHLLNCTFDRRIITRGNTYNPTMWHSTVETVMPPRRVVPVEAVVTVRRLDVVRAYSPLLGKTHYVERHGDAAFVRLHLGEYDLIVFEYY